MKFTKAFLKFMIFVSVFTALALIAVGAFILLFPQFAWTIFIYIVGGGLLLFGLVILGSLLAALIKAKLTT